MLNENVTNKKLITESIISSNEDNVASTEFKYFHTEKEIPISFDKGKEYSFFFREGNMSNVIKDFN